MKDDEEPTKDVFGSGSLHHAVGSRDIDTELVKRIVTDDPESARHRNQFGRLPLHYALDRTNINADVILLLLQVYPEGANVEDNDHQTPYDLSLKWGHSRRIHRALLEACPSQDWQYLLQLRWGVFSPLMQSFENFIHPSSSPPTAAVIHESHPHPEHPSEDDHHNPIINENKFSSASNDDDYMSSPSSPANLPSAAITSRKDSTQSEYGRLKAMEEVEQEQTKDVFGSGNLHHAVGCRDIEYDRVKRIVTDDPESARHLNQFGRLPLHYALDRTNINADVILLLLRVYPEGANVEDNDHQTPYDLSLKWGHSRRIHRALLEACPSQDWQYLLQLRWGLLTPLVRCFSHPPPPPFQAVEIPELQRQSSDPTESQQPQQQLQPLFDDHQLSRPNMMLQSPMATVESEDRPLTFIDIDIPPHEDPPPVQESMGRTSNMTSHPITTTTSTVPTTPHPINGMDVNHHVIRVVNTTVIHHNHHDNNDNDNDKNDAMNNNDCCDIDESLLLFRRQKPNLSIHIPESPKRKRRRSLVFDPTDE